MNICGYYPESINEGSGVRAVIYISGCLHRCPGCFNPRTWNFDYGEKFDQSRQQQILNDLHDNPLLQGITLCGGDPFFSALALIPFVSRIKQELPHLDIWAYSGFTYEELLQRSDATALLSLIDVLIDGPYQQDFRDVSLAYRGSSNQRFIDVQNSLFSHQTILIKD